MPVSSGAAFGLGCYLFPALLPFFGVSLSAYLALRAWRPSALPPSGGVTTATTPR